MDWKKALLDYKKNINDAIKCLNSSAARIVVVTKNKKFLGIINDGDIRRSFLKGIDFTDSISSIIKKKPLICDPRTSITEVRDLMIRNNIYQIPIVDRNNKIFGIHTIDNIKNNKISSSVFVIVAGGYGKRLLPLTEKTPKPLIKINGKMMIEHIIEKAKFNGFKNFYISVYYKKDKIKKYLGNGSKFDINIKYIEEKTALGTAGFLSLINKNQNKTFVISNCDILTNTNYQKLLDYHFHNKCSATMVVKTHEIANPYGVVNIKGSRIVGFEEKPIFKSLINIGIYVIESSELKYLKNNTKIDMPDFFNLLILKKKKVLAFPLHETWIDLAEFNKLK